MLHCNRFSISYPVAEKKIFTLWKEAGENACKDVYKRQRIADAGTGAFHAVALPPQLAPDDIADPDLSPLLELLDQRAGKRDKRAGLPA